MLNYSKTSLNAKFWCWYYVKKPSRLPASICPYFWSSLWAWVALIPYLLVSFPVILVNVVKPSTKSSMIDKSSDRFVFGLVGHVLIHCIIAAGCFIAGFFIGFGKPNSTFEKYATFGAVITVFSIIGFILWQLHKWQESKKQYDEYGWEIRKPSSRNIIVDGIKDFYNKHCTPINWVD